MAVVEGSGGESYITAVDFSAMEEGELGVWCDCPWFQKGNNCKHLWGTLCQLERAYQIPLSQLTRLELYETDASTMEVGESLPSPSRSAAVANRTAKSPSPPNQSSEYSIASPRPANGQAQRFPTTIRQKGVSSWKNVLESIAQAKRSGSNSQPSEIPAQVFQDAHWQHQHWFVLSLAELANQQCLQVNTLASTRKADGDWGKPVPCYVSPYRLRATIDERERAVFSLLEPVGGSTSLGYYRHDEYAAFRLDPSVLDESLEALHATGRFAWKLSDSRYFEDAAAIRQSTRVNHGD